MYKISIKLSGDTYEGKGATMLEALESIKKPVKIFTKGVIKVTDGKKQFERPLTVQQTKRIFYPLAQKVISKSLTLGLK